MATENKKTRRGNGEGSIYKRNDTWVGQYTVGRKQDGKLKLKYVYGKTRAEVKDKLNQKQNDLNRGVYIEDHNITLDEWVYDYLETYKKPVIEEATYIQYLASYKNHAEPVIGFFFIRDISNLKIQQFYNSLAKKGLSAQSIKQLHNTLDGSFKKAVALNLINRNPCDGSIRPKIVRPEINILTKSQQSLLMNSLKSDSVEDAAIFVALYTGLRMGELLALTWDDINFDKLSINIDKSLKRASTQVSNNSKQSVLYIKTTKTPAGIRVVPINNDLKDFLLEYKKFYTEILDSKTIKKISNRVFFSLNRPDGLADSSRFLNHLRKKLEELNLPKIRFHDLRHSFTTRLMESNIHPKIASTILGHSSAKITLDVYTHVSEQQKLDAIQNISFL